MSDEPAGTVSSLSRWRGEHRCIRAIKSFSVGLSPLARGTQLPDGDFAVIRFVYLLARETHSQMPKSVVALGLSRWRGETP